MKTVHKVTNGANEVMGWAIIQDGEKIVGKFDTVEEACEAAKEYDEVAILKAIKASKFYNATKVATMMKEVKFATEYEVAKALWSNGWDSDKAYDDLMFS